MRLRRRTPLAAPPFLAALLLGGSPAAAAAQASPEGDAPEGAPRREAEAFPGRALGAAGDAGMLFLRDTWDVVTFPADMGREDWWTFAGVLAAGAVALAFDEDIQEAVEGPQRSATQDAVRDAGDALEPLALMGNTNVWLAGAAVGGWLAGREGVTRVAGELLYAQWIASLTRKSVGHLVGRARPEDGLGAYDFGVGEGTSFPSGHASTIAQVAYVVSRHVDAWPVDALAWGAAATVVFQRVDAGKHWASDAFIGAAWGVAVANVVVDNHEGPDGDGGLRTTLRPAPGGVELALSLPAPRF